MFLSNHLGKESWAVIAISHAVEFKDPHTELTRKASIGKAASQAVNQPFISFSSVSHEQPVEMAFTDTEAFCSIGAANLALLNLV